MWRGLYFFDTDDDFHVATLLNLNKAPPSLIIIILRNVQWEGGEARSKHSKLHLCIGYNSLTVCLLDLIVDGLYLLASHVIFCIFSEN